MFKKSCVVFQKDATGYFIPWLNCFMVFMAVFFLMAGFGISNALNLWGGNITQSMTIQIPTFTADGSPREEAVTQDIEAIQALAKAYPMIKEVRVITDREMSELMQNWLGPESDVTQLPLPKLLDVSLQKISPTDIDKFALDLSEQVPAAILDSHRLWLQDLVQFTDRLGTIIFVMMGLILITAVITIMYATKSSLYQQNQIIALIHRMGGGDLYIILPFAFRSLRLTLEGALIGTIIAFLTVWTLGKMLSTSVGDLTCSAHQIMGIIGVPFGLALCAFLTSFFTVRSYLRHFL